MKKYGLIGKSLSHSFSKNYFTQFFKEQGIDARYDLLEFENESALKKFFEKEVYNYSGLNVTIPYKETVIPFLDGCETAISKINAVNTIKVSKDNLEGFNTDVYGFRKSLIPLLTDYHQTALIFGTGGASKAVAYVLNQLELPFRMVSRKEGEKRWTYDELTLSQLKKYKIWINTTPVGTFPNIDEVLPLDKNAITNMHLLFDLVYNPEMTSFMKLGQGSGCQLKNGHDMLIHQAEKAWEIWQKG